MASPAAPGVSSAPAPAQQAPTPATPEAPERLPGVIPEDFTGDDQRTPRRLRPIPPGKSAIDRLTESEEQAPAEPAEPGTETSEQPVEQPVEPFLRVKVPGFKEGDPERFKEFSTREAIEDYVRTTLGQQKRYKSDRDVAATRANEWKARADQLEAENAALRNGAPVAPAAQPVTAMQNPSAPVAQQEAQKAFEEAVDWDFVRELHETKGPEYANFYLMRSLRQFMTEYVSGQIAQATAPERERQVQLQTLHAAAGLFERVSEYRDEAGNPYMPELHDPNAQEAIARIYVGLGFDPLADKPELGVHYAVLAYREWARRGAATSPSTAAPAAGVLQGLTQAQGAASHVLSGNGTPRPAPPGSTPELQLKRAIREAGTFIPGAGFMP